MGPPKNIKVVGYADLLRKYDYFEYRWNTDSQAYYLFNPYTGETIIQPSFEQLDRTKSTWAATESHVSREAQTVILFAESYKSRRWGRRRFNGWINKQAAATHLAAVIRGFIVRQNLRHYFRQRYTKKTCPESGYYYFIDNFYPESESVWYKPLLAFPDDILPFKKYDHEDYLTEKYSNMKSSVEGPFIKRLGLGKLHKCRAHHTAFTPDNPWRDIAIHQHKDIDLENTPLHGVISWLEGCKSSQIYLSEYAQMRAAIVNNNWGRVLHYMEQEPDNVLCQLFGYFSFAKSDIPLDSSGIIDFAGADVLEKCIEILKSPYGRVGSTVKLFSFLALHNILSSRQGRAEHFNIMSVIDSGEGRTAAIEGYIRSRIVIFNKYLVQIPTEPHSFSERGSDEMKQVMKPTSRGCDLAEAVLKIMAVLAHESEYREQMAFITSDATINAVKVCEEIATVVLPALQYMYNLCYRCESGQEALIACGAKQVLQTIHYYHSGDPEIMRQSRRLELALKKDGWRGNVEESIETEMCGGDLDSVYLRSINNDDNDDDLRALLEPPAIEKSDSKADGKNQEKGRGEKDKQGDVKPAGRPNSNQQSNAGKAESKSSQDKFDNDDISIASELTA